MREVAEKIIDIAYSVSGTKSAMQSSAEVCLADARRLHAYGQYEYACNRALKSIAYSVGILSEEYATARNMF